MTCHENEKFPMIHKVCVWTNLHDSNLSRKMKVNLKIKSIRKNSHEHLMKFGPNDVIRGCMI